MHHCFFNPVLFTLLSSERFRLGAPLQRDEASLCAVTQVPSARCSPGLILSPVPWPLSHMLLRSPFPPPCCAIVPDSSNVLPASSVNALDPHLLHFHPSLCFYNYFANYKNNTWLLLKNYHRWPPSITKVVLSVDHHAKPCFSDQFLSTSSGTLMKKRPSSPTFKN